MIFPRISVITITLNNSSGLQKTMESVFSQDYPAPGFIVIDGGSHDDTLNLLRRNEHHISKWRSEPDNGPYDAMNKGLALAIGEWVIFMNAGDRFHDPGVLKAVAPRLLTGAGVVYGDSVADFGTMQAYRKAGNAEQLWKGMVMCHQSVFVRTFLAKRLMFDTRYSIGADFDMLYRLYLKGVAFTYIPRPVSVIDAGGISNRKMIRSAREHYRIVSRYETLMLNRKMYHYVTIMKVGIASSMNVYLPLGFMNFLRKIFYPPPTPSRLVGRGLGVGKILLVNTYDTKGGAARAVTRLWRGLLSTGVDATLLVQNKESSDPAILQTGNVFSRRFFNPLRPYLDVALPILQSQRRMVFSTAMVSDRIPELTGRINPDIVHLNWVNGGMMQVESLAKIGRPLVWTLHDMWAFTGGCHYSASCNRYHDRCGACPQLNSLKEKDLSRRLFLRKQEAYAKIRNLEIVTPGRWLADRVKESRLLGDRRVTVIPNGLDTGLFVPQDKTAARKELGLPAGRKLILFGAIRGLKSPLKGFNHLIRALQNPALQDIDLVIFGSEKTPVDTGSFRGNIHFFGHVQDDRKLVNLYSAADITAVPSLQEVFGQTVTESMACGTPVVAYAATGPLDLIGHQSDGFLARAFEPDELGHGIQWLLDDPGRLRQISGNARANAVAKFDYRNVAQQYKNLYEAII